MSPLEQATQDFAAEHPEYATPRGAYLQCDTASAEFVEFLHGHELVPADVALDCASYTFWLDEGNIDPEMYEQVKHDTHPWVNCNGHTVVDTPDFYVDFTARQYRSTHPYPLIIKKKATAAAGGE